MLAKKGDCPVKACKGFFSLPPRYVINNDQTCNLLFELWESNQSINQSMVNFSPWV